MPIVVWGTADLYCPTIKFLESWDVGGDCGVSTGETNWGLLWCWGLSPVHLPAVWYILAS